MRRRARAWEGGTAPPTAVLDPAPPRTRRLGCIRRCEHIGPLGDLRARVGVVVVPLLHPNALHPCDHQHPTTIGQLLGLHNPHPGTHVGTDVTSPHLRTALDQHHAEGAVRRPAVMDETAVTRLEHVQREKHAGHDHAAQRKHGRQGHAASLARRGRKASLGPFWSLQRAVERSLQ
jgi:hypothetical protein